MLDLARPESSRDPRTGVQRQIKTVQIWITGSILNINGSQVIFRLNSEKFQNFQFQA